MDIPSGIPEEKRQLLQGVVERLAQVPHLEAVVLGGSYAAGTAQAASDLDIGLYFFEAEPFDIRAIRQVANEVSREGATPTVTDFYQWGAWVNGGAWIQTGAGKLDFLYRNLDHVRRTIREAQEGICRHDYDQQPANGFYSTGYLEETRICIPLYDPQGRLAELKELVQVYPPKLKEKIIADSLWSAEFTLMHARGFAEKGDVYNTAGCLVRAAANLTQALFALNEVYFLSDKKAMEKIATFRLLPEGYVEQVVSILSQPGREVHELQQSVEKMEMAWKAVKELAK